MKPNKLLLVLLLLLNAMVLLGQAWPEGAPPFANIVNIVTLSLNIIFILVLFRPSKAD